MLKLMIIGRRAPGRSRRDAQRHLRAVHGQMVVSPPPDAGPMPADYVQNHVRDGAYKAAGGPHAVERDLVTELWFDSMAHLRESTQTPYYLTYLRPDEPRFVDDSSVARLMVTTRSLRAGDESVFKVYFLLTRADAPTADAGWENGLNAARARLLAASGLTGASEHAAMPGPDGARAFVDVILEGRFAALDGASAVLERLDDYLADFADGALDRNRAFGLAAEQFDTARLRGLPERG